MRARRRKHWGWGYEDEQPSPHELRSTAAFLAEHLGFGSIVIEPFVPLSEVSLPAPRLRVGQRLSEICFVEDYERALHATGSSYRDVVRGFRGRFDHPPDVVAVPAASQSWWRSSTGHWAPGPR